MTDQQLAILSEYVRTLADQMQLRDWRITVELDPAEDGLQAQVMRVYNAKVAYIRVAHGFQSTSAEEQRNTIVHELLHCVLTPIDYIILKDVKTADLVGRQTFDLLEATYTRSLENTVEDLTKIIAPALPVISWSET